MLFIEPNNYVRVPHPPGRYHSLDGVEFIVHPDGSRSVRMDGESEWLGQALSVVTIVGGLLLAARRRSTRQPNNTCARKPTTKKRNAH